MNFSKALLIFCLFGCALNAEEATETPPLATDVPVAATEISGAPVFLAKLRVLPVAFSFFWYANTGLFEHSAWLDFEVPVDKLFSLALSAAHLRETTNYSRAPITGKLATDTYVQEFQLGLLASYYFRPLDARGGSSYVRAEGYVMLPDTTKGTTQSGVQYTNRAVSNFGCRGGLELGYELVADHFVLDVGGGLSLNIKNPYNQFAANEFLGSFGNLFLGFSTLYPIANLSMGYSF